VYSRELLEGIADLAQQHHLMVLCDELYDRIVYDGGVHHHLAALAPDVLCLTMSGLSKSHRVAGFRTGWLVVSGPRQHARNYLEA
jgi:alanine-synthesizing transaminase